MESLPFEIVEMIVQHLSGQDLAACCATSHSWRHFFNRDLFWKRLCKEGTSTYLSRTPCRVKPAFISPEVKGSGLDLVCQWRINYMRENHLLNNWRTEKYLKENVFLLSYNTEVLSRLNLFYQEEFLIGVKSCSNRRMEVVIWDLRCEPVIYVNDPCLLLPSVGCNNLCLCGNRLVIQQRSVVLVFQINLMKRTWPLEHTILFLEDKFTDFISVSRAYQEQQFDWSYYDNYTLLVGNYFLASNKHYRMYLHIWDIVHGKKLKKERLDSKDYFISKIKHSTTSLDDIVVFLSETDRPNTKVVVYSLLSFTYYQCNFEGAVEADLHRDKIVVFLKIPSDHCLIANYKTGEQILRVEELGCLPLKSFDVFNNKLIYIANGGLNQMNLSTGEIKQFLCTTTAVEDFQLLGDKLICLQFLREDSRFEVDDLFTDRPTDIWKICGSKRLVKIFTDMLDSNYVKSNTTMSKMVVDHKFMTNVISFW